MTEVVDAASAYTADGEFVVASPAMLELPAVPAFAPNEPGVPLEDLCAGMMAAATTVREALAMGEDERAGYRARIQGLLESGNRNIEEARAARREAREARWEADVWRRRALELEGVVHRMSGGA